MRYKSLTATKQNIIKMKFPYIDTFNHQGSAVVRAMRNLTVGVFEHLETTPPTDVDQRIGHMQRILRKTALKKYKQVFSGCKETVKGIAGHQWALGATKDVNMEQFWTSAKTENIDSSGDMYLISNWCSKFEKNTWFELGKSMWRKNRSIF